MLRWARQFFRGGLPDPGIASSLSTHPHRLIFTCKAEDARVNFLFEGGQLFKQVRQFPQLHGNLFWFFPLDF